MKIRIHGGTARNDEPSLCTSCRSAMIVRGPSTRDEIVKCSAVGRTIDFKVTSCSEYIHHGHPSLWHMEDIAWILRTDAKHRQVGFVRARDLKPSLQHVLEED